jgi:NAD(P)-dependent dehydrogenase (short-subunit alcohol dehydrogenase family)
MSKKIILITGANTGLGYEAVKALAQSTTPYEILLGSRKVSNGEEAVAKLKQEVPQTTSTVSVVQADISSDDSINALIQQIESRYGHLDSLINNAGAGFDGSIRDGRMSIREAFNASWDTNVSGTQVLTTAAMPLLFKSSNPQLMFVTSGTSSLIETEDLENQMLKHVNGAPEKGWPKPKQLNPITSYRSTKTGLNMLMREWARILRDDGVKVWGVSPGFLATGLGGVGSEQLKKASP